MDLVPSPFSHAASPEGCGMSELLMYLTNGVVIGVIHAISAIGVSLIVGIMKVVNFAHGELYIFAGYFSYHLTTTFGFRPFWPCPFPSFLSSSSGLEWNGP